MNAYESLTMRIAPWAIPFLTIGIFVVDLLTPVGIAVSILYIIPLLLSLFTSRERDPIYFCGLATGLLWVGLFLKPAGSPLMYGVLNRTLGTSVLWILAVGLIHFRRTQQKTRETGRALVAERIERAHAEGLMVAAQEARTYADAAALGALAIRRVAEEQLESSRIRLEGIIQSAMDAIITVDEDQRVVLFNRAAEQMFGSSTQEAIGQPLDRFLPERFRGAHHHHVYAFGQSDVTSRRMGELGAVRGLRSSGEEFPIEAAISHNTVEGKKFYTVILRDITERMRAEEQFRATVEASPNGLLMVDEQGAIGMVNQQIEQLFGYERAELIGQSVEMLVPQSQRSHHAGDRREFFAHSDSRAMGKGRDLFGLRKDGTEFPLEIGLRPVLTPQGKRVLASVVDISERKQRDAQMQKAQRLAELGTLASGMAHEIGTPMNVILGRAEYLMDRVKDEPTKKGLQTITVQVERITKVMNQLLAYARRKPPERGPLILKDIMGDSLELFRERFVQSGVRVELAWDDQCPAAQADADQMSQVFINLVMNALHAMPDGGTLRVGLAQENGMVKLTVADTGHGIPRDALPRIFEPFFTTKEFGKGTGLGLTVVKGIIEEHQGTITVDSEEGKGTTFTIVLPQADSQ